jgi:hypothetical protein
MVKEKGKEGDEKEEKHIFLEKKLPLKLSR